MSSLLKLTAILSLKSPTVMAFLLFIVVPPVSTLLLLNPQIDVTQCENVAHIILHLIRLIVSCYNSGRRYLKLQPLVPLYHDTQATGLIPLSRYFSTTTSTRHSLHHSKIQPDHTDFFSVCPRVPWNVAQLLRRFNTYRDLHLTNGEVCKSCQRE